MRDAERLREADHARERQGAVGFARRGRLCRRILPLVRRGSRAQSRLSCRIAPASGARILVQHKPAGIAVLVTPWNFPAAMATRKIGPALAAGCPVVLKPASDTPLTMLALMPILEEAGVPAGVVNVIPSRSLRQGGRAPCCTTAACAWSRSPARPKSAASCCTRPPTTSSSRRWSSAATRRSSCSRMPISMPRSRAR